MSLFSLLPEASLAAHPPGCHTLGYNKLTHLLTAVAGLSSGTRAEWGAHIPNQAGSNFNLPSSG